MDSDSLTLWLFDSLTLWLFDSFSIEHMTLPFEHHALPTELADHLMQVNSKLTIFMQLMYASYLKRE